MLCEGLAEPYADIKITRYVDEPKIHEASGQRVREIHATLRLANAATAEVIRFVGTSDEGFFYTGYPDTFLDYYQVLFADGTIYADHLERVGEGHPDYDAWISVFPIRNRVWEVYLQRKIDNLPIVG